MTGWAPPSKVNGFVEELDTLALPKTETFYKTFPGHIRWGCYFNKFKILES